MRAAEKCPRSLEGETPRSQDRGHFVFYPWSAVLRLGCLPAPPCVLDGRDEPWTVRAGKLSLRVLLPLGSDAGRHVEGVRGRTCALKVASMPVGVHACRGARTPKLCLPRAT